MKATVKSCNAPYWNSCRKATPHASIPIMHALPPYIIIITFMIRLCRLTAPSTQRTQSYAWVPKAAQVRDCEGSEPTTKKKRKERQHIEKNKLHILRPLFCAADALDRTALRQDGTATAHHGSSPLASFGSHVILWVSQPNGILPWTTADVQH